MAPDKFEKQLKETLERRTIAPSNTAWSQLADRLETEDRKRKFPIWWLGIAATLAGVFFAISIFNNEKKPVNGVVNETKNEVIDIKDITPIKKKKLIVEEQPVQNKIQTLPITKKTQRTVKNRSTIINKTYNKKAEQNIANNSKINITQTPIKNRLLLEKKDQLNTLVEVQKEKPKEDEATSLLDKAFAEVILVNTNNSIENIDANSLLEEVEIESEISLKNRLFHVVKSGFETVKTAVVERDN